MNFTRNKRKNIPSPKRSPTILRIKKISNVKEKLIFPHGKNSLQMIKWDKVFKNGPSKICGRQPLKSLK